MSTFEAWGATAAPARARAARTDVWPDTARIMPWAVAAFLTMTWLVPFNAITVGTPLPVDRAVLGILVGLWVLALIDTDSARRPRVFVGKLHVAVIGFAVIGFLSLFLNIGLLTNLGELQLATKKHLSLVCQILFFVIAASVIRREELGRFAALMVGLAAVSSIAAIFEYRADYNIFYNSLSWVPGITLPPDLVGVDYVGRQTTYGPTDAPLELSTQLAMALPFAIIGVLSIEDERKRRWAGLATGLILAGIFATERKTGIIGVALGGIILLAYRPHYIKSVLRLALVLVLTMRILAPGAMGSMRQQLTPDHLFGSLSNRDRASDYGAVLPDIITHPAFGRGYASYEPYKYRILDNEWLGIAIQVGLIGVAVFAATLLAALFTAHRAIRSRTPGITDLALACSCTVAGIAAAAALFDILAFPHVMYTFFFVLALLAVMRAPAPESDGARAAEA